jgi:hypothetical protein
MIPLENSEHPQKLSGRARHGGVLSQREAPSRSDIIMAK